MPQKWERYHCRQIKDLERSGWSAGRNGHLRGRGRLGEERHEQSTDAPRPAAALAAAHHPGHRRLCRVRLRRHRRGRRGPATRLRQQPPPPRRPRSRPPLSRPMPSRARPPPSPLRPARPTTRPSWSPASAPRCATPPTPSATMSASPNRSSPTISANSPTPTSPRASTACPASPSPAKRRRGPQHRHPRPRHQLHPHPAQRRADGDRLDRAHRFAEHQPRGRSQPVPDRTVHPADRQQEPARRDDRGRRRRHGQHAQRAAVRQSGHRTSSIPRRGPTTATPIAGAAAARWSRARTFGDFGILVGVAGVRSQTRTVGYETIGWTNPNLTGAQCPPAPPATRPAAAIGRFPAPCRPMPATASTTGTDDRRRPSCSPTIPGSPSSRSTMRSSRGSAARPTSSAPATGSARSARSNGGRATAFHFYVDAMYAHRKNNLQRIDMNWVGRNGATIPLNTQVDQSDCSNGCVVTQATYANAQFFLEYRPFIETTDFWGVNPGFEWNFTDNLKLDAQAQLDRRAISTANRRASSSSPRQARASPSITPTTAAMPNIAVTGADLNNPAAFGWNGGRVNIQDERRRTETRGVRANLTWGDSHLNLHVGGAYDDVTRRISAFDNSQAWQNAVCGDNPSVFLPGPNTQPPCQGLNTATPGRRLSDLSGPRHRLQRRPGRTARLSRLADPAERACDLPAARPGRLHHRRLERVPCRLQLRPVPQCGAARHLVQHRRERRLCPRADLWRLCRAERRHSARRQPAALQCRRPLRARRTR